MQQLGLAKIALERYRNEALSACSVYVIRMPIAIGLASIAFSGFFKVVCNEIAYVTF